MTTKTIGVISVSVFSVAALMVLILVSALRTPQAQAPTTNGPGVIRVSLVDGSAVVRRGDGHVQTNAVRNAPMLPGDYISTGTASRAELQFDGYTAIRLGENVQARIATDDPQNRKVQLAGGTVEIGMVHDGQAVQVETPSVTVRAHQPGDYRISIASDGTSWVTARRGSVDVVTPQRTYTLGTGSTLGAQGSAPSPTVTSNPEIALDGFDDFNVERDSTMVAALNASPNLNPSIAGYDNLDSYGQWQPVVGYGRSWVPNEPAGWAPYRNGSWTWEGGYGWTWIGAEPWGWTPYHYGNWFYCACGGSGWAWLPPSNEATPKWAPALVGFFGFDVAANVANNCNTYSPGGYSSGGYGPSNYNAPASYDNTAPEGPSNAGAPAPYGEGGPDEGSPDQQPYGEGSGGPPPPGYAYPNIGWVPIAPGEPYYPWYPGWAWFGVGWGVPFYGGYGYGGRYVTHITNITNIYRYRNFRHGGASGTTTRDFRHGTIHGHTAPVTARDIGRHSGTIHGTVPVTPTRANLAFTHDRLHAGTSFAKVTNSPRFAPDRALDARNSFAHQQKMVAQAIHGGVSGHGWSHGVAARPSTPVSRANAPITHMHVAETRAGAPQARANVPETHANARETQANAYQAQGTRPAVNENAAVTRASAPVTRENVPVTREHAAPAMRSNDAPAMHGDNNGTTQANSAIRDDSAGTRPIEARNESAPASAWDRFSQARGEMRSTAFSAGSDRGNSEGSAPRDGGQAGGHAPSSAWGRYTDARGDVDASARNPYAERGSYDSTRNPYTERGSYPSYSHGSYGAAPSYSRGSYPSYSHGSYPSYPHGSYAPAPSYSRGNSAPPRSSGGGGGGGARRGGGGRPPT